MASTYRSASVMVVTGMVVIKQNHPINAHLGFRLGLGVHDDRSETEELSSLSNQKYPVSTKNNYRPDTSPPSTRPLSTGKSSRNLNFICHKNLLRKHLAVQFAGKSNKCGEIS
ncbi:hypothetical protein PILCRDRAFT_639352 [Piloderma croceum F 1598]|uniref:Uncharacterized protein n=1 Tax=Piloderma croceum (strain F 1598) TaxID=765440 RepID=A0A0C3BH69_PILCF|nr:hypothetical protein PILCRDRAFT_639352 [Piloderma croceum F 1598]